MGFCSGASCKEPACQCRKLEMWVWSLNWEDPWRRAWQPTPVFLLGEYLWTEEASGLESVGSQRVRHNWSNLAHAHAHYRTAFISHVLLKILHARLQQLMNQELPDVQDGLWASRGSRDKMVNIRWIVEKARKFQKNIYFYFTCYSKAFDSVDHNKLLKILKEMEISDHITCLLKNLYEGQEVTVRTRHGTMDWFKIGKGVHQTWILLFLFNLYAEYIMRNTGLDESQAGIKIARSSINKLRYAL